MKTSLITVTWNRARQLLNGMYTLSTQTRKPDEIIIVDDGSTDTTKDVIPEITKLFGATPVNYIYIDHPEARISCIPRNVGIKAATGDHLIFTEPEILHPHKNIEKLIHRFETEVARTIVATQVWTIQEKIYNKLLNEDLWIPERLFTHPYAQLTSSSNLQNTKAPNSDWAITGSNNCLTGCLFMVKKQWIMDIGGFDESFEGHGWDDFDIFERLNLYGRGIYQDNSIPVFHQWHTKNYPYNTIDAGTSNGRLSQERIKKGEYRANIDKEWGVI